MLRRRNGCGGGCRKRSGGNNGCGAEWVRIGDRLRRVFQKNQFRSDPSLRNWLQTIRLNQNARSKSVCPLEIIDIHYIRRASREIIPVFIAGAGNYQRIAALCGFSLLVIPVNLYFQVFERRTRIETIGSFLDNLSLHCRCQMSKSNEWYNYYRKHFRLSSHY